nr:gypsy retrotransposon integrase-like protein 1 [Tanacetum cinerariifolium]
MDEWSWQKTWGRGTGEVGGKMVKVYSSLNVYDRGGRSREELFPVGKKLALSLLHMSRRLRRYFEAHPINVITDQPLKQILNKAQVSGKLVEYSVALGAYNIAYEPRSAMKGQILADFLSEAPVGTPIKEFFRLPAKFSNKDDMERWTLFTDEASNSKGLPMVRKMKVQNIDVKVDSKLAASQINESYVKLKPIGQHLELAGHPTDARNVTQKCDSCQVHAPVLRRPKTLMTSIMASWPFYQWGMDILEPLPQASGKLKFFIIAIDYFTKWIEAKPLVRITGKDVKKFVWENIVCRLTYGSEAVIPAEIGMPTHRTMMIREDENEDELRLNIDLLQEIREVTEIREAKYKTKMEQYYNQKVRPMSFKPDEYVFRRNESQHNGEPRQAGSKVGRTL